MRGRQETCQRKISPLVLPALFEQLLIVCSLGYSLKETSWRKEVRTVQMRVLFVSIRTETFTLSSRKIKSNIFVWKTMKRINLIN